MAQYSTRVFVKVDNSDLMEELCTISIDDLGNGFFSSEDVFTKNVAESYFYDTESSFNEYDIQSLVKRVAEVIGEKGLILADTWSYDYDPLPQVCFYNGEEMVSKLLGMDGYEFQRTVDIRNVSEWINFVKDAEDASEDEYYDEDEILYMYKEDGMSPEEIAEDLEIKLETVKAVIENAENDD